MENQTKQQEGKLTKGDFFKQMRNLLDKAPVEVTFSVIVLENIENINDEREGLVCTQGSPMNLTHTFFQAFKRSDETKESIFQAVEFYKLYSSITSPSSILQDILRGRRCR